MSGNPDSFTTRVRKATRKIHSVSDAFVNAKFAITLQDDVVWGKGLLMFYHVFAYLEDAKERLNMPDFNRLFVHEILYRKKAFESDLTHYLGESWSSLPHPVALEIYLDHLQELENDNPVLLMAYVYHLYLGLLSGGQIIAKKKSIVGSKSGHESYTDEVTNFGEVDIAQLKKKLKDVMNSIAETMSEEVQQAFIGESNEVFMMNNMIVNSIEGQNQVIYNMLYKVSAVAIVIVGAVFVYKMRK